jgi:hypothetical protein
MRVTCGNGIAVEILGHNDIRRQRGRVSANLGGTGSPTGHAAALASPAMNSLRRISHASDPAAVRAGAYRGQGRVGTGLYRL